MKEKDELLKLIEDWTGREETLAKVFLGFISFILISSIVLVFYVISLIFKFTFNLF